MTHGHTGPHSAPAPTPPNADPAPLSVGMVMPGVDSARLSMHPAESEMVPTLSGEDRAQAEMGLFFGEGPPLSADAPHRIAQLLGDAVSHLITAGLDLASVRARLRFSGDDSDLEHVTNNLDAALADIRGLAVRIALGTDPREQEEQ